jgi:hypothetical protein
MERRDRREYFSRIYTERKASGLCVKSGCAQLTTLGRTLCDRHRAKHNRFARGAKRMMALEKSMSRREKLPNDRKGTTLHFTILERFEKPTGEIGVREVKGYLTTGEYEDGRLGEVFFKLGKPGSSEALLDQLGVASSMALQYGCGVDELFGKYVNTRFEPSGAVLGVGGVQRCTSVLDLAARWLIARYGAVHV